MIIQSISFGNDSDDISMADVMTWQTPDLARQTDSWFQTKPGCFSILSPVSQSLSWFLIILEEVLDLWTGRKEGCCSTLPPLPTTTWTIVACLVPLTYHLPTFCVVELAPQFDTHAHTAPFVLPRLLLLPLGPLGPSHLLLLVPDLLLFTTSILVALFFSSPLPTFLPHHYPLQWLVGLVCRSPFVQLTSSHIPTPYLPAHFTPFGTHTYPLVIYPVCLVRMCCSSEWMILDSSRSISTYTIFSLSDNNSINRHSLMEQISTIMVNNGNGNGQWLMAWWWLWAVMAAAAWQYSGWQ